MGLLFCPISKCTSHFDFSLGELKRGLGHNPCNIWAALGYLELALDTSGSLAAVSSFMPLRTNGEPQCRQCWGNIEVGATCPHPVNGDCPDHGVWPGGQWAGTSLNQLSKKGVHFRQCGTLCWPAGSPSMSRTSPWTPPPLTSSGTGWTGSTLTSGKSSPTARTWTADQGKERLEEVLEGPDSRGSSTWRPLIRADPPVLCPVGPRLPPGKRGCFEPFWQERTKCANLRRFGRAAEADEEAQVMAAEPSESARQISALKKFATNNQNLEEMGRLAKEFDAFSFLGLSGVEKTHSDILEWLLDPRGNHGAGDYFLKEFLTESGGATRQDIRSYDWSGTTVRREWRNEVDGEVGFLDILVLNQEENFVCAIENKIFSTEHSAQLTRYRKAVEAQYPHLNKSHLFLSPEGTSPDRAEDRKYWTPVDYGKVLHSVEATLREGVAQENHAVAAFLCQYITTLRRNIVPNTTVTGLATRIYLQHREAIDLIIRHREAYIEDLKGFCEEAIRQQSGWMLDSPQAKLVGFFHNDWKSFDSFQTGKGWDRESDAALRFHFDLRDMGRVHLILTIPQGDSEDVTRLGLFDMAKRQPNVFDFKDSTFGGKYTPSWIRLHVSEPILSEEDFVNWDREAARQRILHWVGKFASDEFPAMNDAIVACFQGVDENRR